MIYPKIKIKKDKIELKWMSTKQTTLLYSTCYKKLNKRMLLNYIKHLPWAFDYENKYLKNTN